MQHTFLCCKSSAHFQFIKRDLYEDRMSVVPDDSVPPPLPPRLTSTESAGQVDPSYRPKVLKRSGQSIDSPEFDVRNQAKILVLYCGGTIGMRSHGGGEYSKLRVVQCSLYKSAFSFCSSAKNSRVQRLCQVNST